MLKQVQHDRSGLLKPLRVRHTEFSSGSVCSSATDA